MEEFYLKILIQKYIEETASDAEREELINWYRNTSRDQLELPYHSEQEEEESRRRMLSALLSQMSKGAPAHVRHLPYLKIALVAASVAAIAILLQLGGVWSSILGDKPTRYEALITRKGEHKIIALADGSKIWLGSESEFLYPHDFKGSTREVTLSGEAFFEIAKDKKHPFIVHTGAATTKVLGTSFSVSAFKNQPEVKVSLITGKVEFATGKDVATLVPGNEIIFNKLKNEVRVEVIPNMDAVANRRNGLYQYENALVSDIVDDINLNFNTNIVTQGEVKNCRFFGRLKPGESIEMFLTKLCKVTSAQLVKVNNGYLIKGRGCN